MLLWLRSGCLTFWALNIKACEGLTLWSFGLHVSMSFLVVAECVAKRLKAYSWPPELELRSQYRDLMMHWEKLCTSADVKTCPGTASAQAGKDISAAAEAAPHRWSTGIIAAGHW